MRAERRRWFAGTLLLATAIATVDVALGGNVVLIGFLATAPLLAATRLPPRLTGLAVLWSLVLGVAVGEPDGIFATTDHAVRLAVVLTVGLIAVWMASVRTGLDTARWRYSLIADAGAILQADLDYELTLIEIARLSARQLCDWCFVFVAEEDGSIRQLAAAHVDPERERLAWELLFRYPLDPERPEGPAKVIRTGEPDLQPRVDESLLAAISADEENLRLLRALGLRSTMIVPLVARGRTVGAVAFASAESGVVFGEGDLAVALELARRSAAAIDSARLTTRLRIAEAQLRRSRDQLGAILDGVADAVTAQDPSRRIVYANAAAARLLGFESPEALRAAQPETIRSRWELAYENGDPMPVEALPGRRALDGERPEPLAVRARNAETGELRWWLIKATPIVDEQGHTVLTISVTEDVTDQREREEAQRFLAESSRLLAGTLRDDSTWTEVAELASRELAETCLIAVLDPDGSLRTLAHAHAAAAEGRAPAGAPPPAPRRLDDEEERELVAGRSSVHPHRIAAPMRVRGRVVGAIVLTEGEGRRRFTAHDAVLVEDLAGRCALAIENVRLYRERSRIARTLQESLLPPVLPEVPGMEVAARFRASGVEVGGDYYDLFVTGAGAWSVSIGDVCGKGTEAAALTALARYTVRATAMRESEPSEILSVLNEALLRHGHRRFATVLYGQFEREPGGLRFRFAAGGHPLPIVVRAGGEAGEVGEPGTVLGVVADPTLPPTTVPIGPGDAIVLYTDGVSEAGAPARLLTPEEISALAAEAAGRGAEAIADRLLEAALDAGGSEPRDDIAIVVVRAVA